MEEPIVRKKVKIDEPIVSNDKVMVSLKNSLGELTGEFELATSTTPKQLQSILNELLKQIQNNEYEEFTFFHAEKEIKTKLETFIQNSKFNTEFKFQIVYHPVSHYKVKPITRSSASLLGHTQSVLCSAFSPDSKILATGSGDTTVRIWDLNTQTPLKEVKGSNWVMVLAWAPNSEKFAFGQNNGIIRVHHLIDNRLITLKGHNKWIMSLSWQPLHINAECNRLISGSKDSTMRMWNTDTGTCLRAFGNHIKCITKLIWGGENNIYSCSEDQTIKVWDSAGQYKYEFKKHAHWVNTMALSTEYILKKGCYQNQQESPVTSAAKKQKALALYNKAVKTHKQRLVTGSDDFTLMLFETTKKQPIKRMVGHQQPVNHVQFSPDGRYIISASFDKSLKLWDGYSGQFMFTFKGHVGAVYQVAWSCDSRFLVSGSKDSTMKVWDIKTRKLMYQLPGHADQVYTIDWSCDGEKVASGGKDRQVKIWRH